MFLAARPTNVGGGDAAGENVATKVLAVPSGGELLATCADALALTIATPDEEAAAVTGAPIGPAAECDFLFTAASHVTPANTTTTTVATTNDRRGRGH